ncbi:MAG TPA: MEDS domain-containing protein [Solirubrobacteraceae bacterium]|nr:MEDS domain-containing protein [Solirubrobacteraceae bacterium]
MNDTIGIGSRVRAARDRLGWTREALAFQSGLSWAAITQVESGRRTNVRPGTLASLAGALGVSIDYLVAGTPPGPVMLQHMALPYRSDDELRVQAGAFLAEGVERSEAVIAVTTAGAIELLREELGRSAQSVEFIDSRDYYSTPVAALEGYKSFAEAQLGRGVHWVRVLGEPVWDDQGTDQVRLWTRYESLLNLVFAAYPMTIVCPYDERVVAPEILAQAQFTHPNTLGGGQAIQSLEYADPARFALEP